MDQLLFHFKGRLAEEHKLDFYEAARFQYAAARLTVKLDQFRRTGRFPKRVTTASRTNIDLFAYEKGSFDLKISANDDDDRPLHVDVPLTALWTYIIERVFQPTDTTDALDLIDDDSLRSEFFELVENQMFDASRVIELLRSKIDLGPGLSSDENKLLDRLIAEVERRAYLQSHKELLGQISPAEDAALVTMAAPLLSELAVPLRRSAKVVTISSIDRFGRRNLLSADREMASSIQSIVIDKDVTRIDIDIVQYNKETGWGKFRNDYWKGIPSFSIPADRKSDLKFELLLAMRRDVVSVDSYIVRSKSLEPLRLIIVDIYEADDQNAF